MSDLQIMQEKTYNFPGREGLVVTCMNYEQYDLIFTRSQVTFCD